ncbi:hypothetical protein KO507_01860 [Gilvimarinus agarilyticus]|uniref:hypothetical protein n=1 Tax=Gilvimarinus sp. 2_MG-2023 TaxID=3062666 RepID=UPI001C09DBF9|nr:hypothetical protein [Gilvimarinus sp. 2_MG-2023]MBU2884506.1 hypothetical protein [Gilvimarinus agarilyticus]MDO6569635.1 hypothetical protein [Gilvimarinus sp. 2_MG-2023]
MSQFNRHRDMIELVARALGPEMMDSMAFVGGCTTGLLMTDPYTRETVRYTDDVDVIVSVLGYSQWHLLSEQLQARGFRIAMNEAVNCRFRLGAVQVDFMPDNAEVLGFSNRWYSEALNAAQAQMLSSSIRIRLVTPPYFLATKLEAFKGRGNNDLLESHDAEDIFNLVDGRAELATELPMAPEELRQYLAEEFGKLLKHPDTPYVVQSTARGDSDRENLIFERLEAISGLR